MPYYLILTLRQKTILKFLMLLFYLLWKTAINQDFQYLILERIILYRCAFGFRSHSVHLTSDKPYIV